MALGGLAPAQFPAGDLPNAAAAFAASAPGAQVATVEAVRAAGASYSADQVDAATGPFYSFATYSQAATFAILDDVDNVATPREMAELYWRLFFASGLTADSDKDLRKLMKRGDRGIDRRSIAVPLRYWGGKGGDDLGMGSVAGYGETKRGNHIVYAIMGSHMTSENADWNIIEDLITWAFDTFDAP